MVKIHRFTGYPENFPPSWKVVITMAASKDKTILFARGSHNKAVHQWPVAVFNTPADAKQYATLLRLAYRSGDDAAIKLLDPSARRTDEDKPLPDTKWSLQTVPYAPAPDFAEDDTISE